MDLSKFGSHIHTFSKGECYFKLEKSLLYIDEAFRSVETMLDDSWVIVETGEAEDSQTNTEEDKVEREEREEGDWSGQKWSKYV